VHGSAAKILVVVVGVIVVGAAAVAAALYWEVGGFGSTTAATISPRKPTGPNAPAGYRVPRNAVRVSSSAQLVAALANPRPSEIVLARGVYDNARPFLNPFGHRIYAARSGKAVVRAGMSIGAPTGASGAQVRGVVFDVRDRAKTVNGAIVEVWGSAANVKVLDTVLRGHGVVAAGIVARQPAGFVAKRIVARSFTDFGVLVDANKPDSNALGRFLLEDIDVANVSRRPPRSANGTAEACVWIGNRGIVRRVRVRNCAWMGVWTGTSATGTLVEDVDVDRTPTGIYIEHFTRDSTFQTIHVRPRVRIGIVAEWADPERGGRPASVDNVIQDSLFESYLCGVYLDEGTTRTTVRRSAFRRQRWAAVGDYRGIDNRISDNDYSGVASTAVPVSNDHVSAARGRG
jgi:hypothetical protein